MLFRANSRRLKRLASEQDVRLYAVPWRELLSDIFAWLLIGAGISGAYLLRLGAPGLTGFKILLGSLAFGLLGGMLHFISMERRIIEFFREAKGKSAVVNPKRTVSVTTKMLFFTVSVLFLMAVMVLLMVFMDVNFLLNHKDLLGPEIYMGVFKEILFAFVVLLILSAAILRNYSKNLKAMLTLQLRTMEDIRKGDYSHEVSVVSNDEFGLIAAETNAMLSGLKERDFCQVSFGMYMTPEVSDRILKGEVALEGELRDATILFCDLRGYTPFVEKRDPKEVVRFLNAYFSEMEQAIRNHEGIVLQYIGDEIEAVFGAPAELADHPGKAVQAALEMRRRLEGLNAERVAAGEAPVAHGIGIHSGQVLAGSVGSPERLVYAMVGDTVNVASRIQSLNKKFGTDILISQSTKDRLVGDDIPVFSLGETLLKGKSEEVAIYKVP